jgi:hypothetical protein
MFRPPVVIEHRRDNATIKGRAATRFKGFAEFRPSSGFIERF